MTLGIPVRVVKPWFSMIGMKFFTFGRVEACDLDNVVTLRPLKFVHLFLGTETSELPHVEL